MPDLRPSTVAQALVPKSRLLSCFYAPCSLRYCPIRQGKSSTLKPRTPQVFYALLLFEILLNTIAYGPGGFYNDGWKGFDLLVAVGTTGEMILQPPFGAKIRQNIHQHGAKYVCLTACI